MNQEQDAAFEWVCKELWLDAEKTKQSEKTLVELLEDYKEMKNREIMHATKDVRSMQLRDHFAGEAMNGFLTSEACSGMPLPTLVKASYQTADAMLAERSKT